MKSGQAPLAIAADHPAFAGHFPGQPIVPGVVLLDEALHAIGMAAGVQLSACRINAVKFLSPARPHDPLDVRYEATAGGAIQFEIRSGERRIASGSLRLPDAGAGAQ
jgi:3-hydroxymyristoyl/3-hydroxydecanoyl-(acyl carrier protein) dehydratase